MATKSSKTTTNHDEIRKWAEARSGRPAVVGRTVKNGSGVLRIDFPGYSGEQTLKEISWEQFFEIFEKSNLAFIYQDKTASGKVSRFGKFVERESAGQSGRTKRRSQKHERKAA